MKKSNIIITGFMGTGKTTVGERVAQRLSRQFFDMDQIIEQREQMAIPEIFQSKGETYFREQESRLTRELGGLSEIVVATGGGTLLSVANRQLFLQRGMIFCLTARPEEIHRRLQASRNRPLLGDGNLKERIVGLLRDRESIYSLLANRIDTSKFSPDQVVEIVLQRYCRTTNEDKS